MSIFLRNPPRFESVVLLKLQYSLKLFSCMSVRKRLGPSYDEEKYWDEKFERASESFEWLGSGDVLLKAFQQAFPKSNSSSSKPPRVMHLGAGTSKLSLDLAQHSIEIYNSRKILASILNVDFSRAALKIGKEEAASHGLGGMQYIQVDLRQWSQLKFMYPVNFIVDKSTSDAISTNLDIDLTTLHQTNNKDDLCPLLIEADKKTSMDPLDLVALHLAALSNPGCLWAVLSYSSTRFQIFDQPTCLSQKYWKVVQQESIPAPSGSDNSAAPSVYHWFYLLQRQ